MELGEKVRALFAPTITVCTPDAEDAVFDARAAPTDDEVVLGVGLPPGPYCASANGRKATTRILVGRSILKAGFEVRDS